MKPRQLEFVTVDVFSQSTFGGNPLAVFFAAQQLSGDDMQRIAAEMNYSETTFVLPPDNPANTAAIRIFTPTTELPFAGHPNVGTGFVLASRPAAAPVDGLMQKVFKDGKRQCRMRFEEQAGLVEVLVDLNSADEPTTTTIAAPQPFQQYPGHGAWDIALALGLAPEQLVAAEERTKIVSVGAEFVVLEVNDRQALAACQVQMEGFRQLSAQSTGSEDGTLVYVYCRDARARGSHSFCARMFGPLHGIAEDPATGSAAGALASMLAVEENLEGTGRYEFIQGEEMSRPSRITVDLTCQNGQIFKTQISGECVEVIQGTFTLS